MKTHAVLKALAVGLIAFAQAQIGPLLPEVDPAPPRPAWIQPGLTVTFGDETGQSAVAYLVTRVGPTSAYGLSFRLGYTDAGPSLEVKAGALYQAGSGPLYVAPEAVASMVNRPPPGVHVLSGPGMIGWEIDDAAGVSKYAVRYDAESGAVLEMNGSYTAPGEVGPRRSSAFHFLRLAVEQAAWKPLATFPPAARHAAHYQVFYTLTGGTSPGGTFTVTPERLGPNLASYRVLASEVGSPGQTTEEQGVPALGPHYLHPDLLDLGTVFSFPSIGLSLEAAGSGPNGGALLVFYAGGSGFESLEIDPASGLLLEERVAYPGIGTVVYHWVP